MHLVLATGFFAFNAELPGSVDVISLLLLEGSWLGGRSSTSMSSSSWSIN